MILKNIYSFRYNINCFQPKKYNFLLRLRRLLNNKVVFLINYYNNSFNIYFNYITTQGHVKSLFKFQSQQTNKRSVLQFQLFFRCQKLHEKKSPADGIDSQIQKTLNIIIDFEIGVQHSNKQQFQIQVKPKQWKQTQTKLKQKHKIKKKIVIKQVGNIKHNDSLRHKISELENSIQYAKYQKIKQLLKDQKYILSISQIKHLLPQIQDTRKRKQLYFWLIVCLTKTNKLQTAQQYVHNCLGEFPSFYEAILYLGQISFKLGKSHQAIRAYQKAIIIQESTSEAYIQLSEIYNILQQYTKAQQILLQGFGNCLKSVTIPLKIIQSLIRLGKFQETQKYITRIYQVQKSKTSDYYYAKGIICQGLSKPVESCIYYQQSLKLNTNKQSVAKSLQNYVNIQIHQRDFYSAYHNIKRNKHLRIKYKKLQAYETFLQGSILIMKKLYREGIHSLSQFVIKFKQINHQIHQLVKKYLAYASFKLGNHSQAIKYYKKLDQKSRDQVSIYNLLLAEGIQLVDKKHDFQKGIKKFQQAKVQCPNKVQPFIYTAMTIVMKTNLQNISGQQKYQAVIRTLQILDQAEAINSSSSNLLYHRAIIFLFFQDYDQALKDINRCIQKAQQNLPKYFYLRGLCYACIKQLKKAANQYSIAISLDKQYSQAYLQRSKCYFLLGQSDRGFQDLKLYMELQPQHLSVHHWIGDLLYEGGSYQDALKAYNQMGNKMGIQTICMKMKCQLKLGLFKNIPESFKKIQKLQIYQEKLFKVDKITIQLLSSLINNQSDKTISSKLHKLNNELQISSVGKIFALIDCMLIIGIASFYLNRFKQAYESFLLTLQLHKSLTNSELVIKTGSQDQGLSLKIQDIYINLLLCLIALGNKTEIVRIIKQDLLPVWKDKCQIKLFNKLLKSAGNQFLSNNKQTLYLDNRIDGIFSKNMKKVEVCFKSTIIISSLAFIPFHEALDTLYSNAKAKSIINELHAGYIDNMPQAPWIKRNEYGVIFTDEIMLDQSNCTFLTTERKEQQLDQHKDHQDDNQNGQDDNQNDQDVHEQSQKNKKTFLKQLKLDQQIQKKLSKMLSKGNAKNKSKSFQKVSMQRGSN